MRFSPDILRLDGYAAQAGSMGWMHGVVRNQGAAPRACAAGDAALSEAAPNDPLQRWSAQPHVARIPCQHKRNKQERGSVVKRSKEKGTSL